MPDRRAGRTEPLRRNRCIRWSSSSSLTSTPGGPWVGAEGRRRFVAPPVTRMAVGGPPERPACRTLADGPDRGSPGTDDAGQEQAGDPQGDEQDDHARGPDGGSRFVEGRPTALQAEDAATADGTTTKASASVGSQKRTSAVSGWRTGSRRPRRGAGGSRRRRARSGGRRRRRPSRRASRSARSRAGRRACPDDAEHERRPDVDGSVSSR